MMRSEISNDFLRLRDASGSNTRGIDRYSQELISKENKRKEELAALESSASERTEKYKGYVATLRGIADRQLYNRGNSLTRLGGISSFLNYDYELPSIEKLTENLRNSFLVPEKSALEAKWKAEDAAERERERLKKEEAKRAEEDRRRRIIYEGGPINIKY